MPRQSLPTSYNPNDVMVKRFISLAYEGIKDECLPHDKNFVEKLGDAILYLPSNLPRVVKKMVKNPQCIAITAFVLLHLVNSYFWFPAQTTDVIKAVVSLLPEITKEHCRFGAWFTTSSIITGACLRAGGRLTQDYIGLLLGKQPVMVIELQEEELQVAQ